MIMKGWGVLGIVIPFTCALVSNVILDSIYGSGFYKNDELAVPLTMLIASIAVYIFGDKLNNKPPTTDSETGLRVEKKAAIHSIYWIPLEYWGFIVLFVVIYIKSN